MKVGQKVVCLVNHKGLNSDGGRYSNPPQKDKIYVVVESLWQGLVLEGYPKFEHGVLHTFRHKSFAPLQQWKIAEKLVAELLQEVNEPAFLN